MFSLDRIQQSNRPEPRRESGVSSSHPVDLLFGQFPIDHLQRSLLQQLLAFVQNILMPLWNFDSDRIRCQLRPDSFQQCKLLGQRQSADFGLSNHTLNMTVEGAESNWYFRRGVDSATSACGRVREITDKRGRLSGRACRLGAPTCGRVREITDKRGRLSLPV